MNIVCCAAALKFILVIHNFVEICCIKEIWNGYKCLTRKMIKHASPHHFVADRPLASSNNNMGHDGHTSRGFLVHICTGIANIFTI